MTKKMGFLVCAVVMVALVSEAPALVCQLNYEFQGKTYDYYYRFWGCGFGGVDYWGPMKVGTDDPDPSHYTDWVLWARESGDLTNHLQWGIEPAGDNPIGHYPGLTSRGEVSPGPDGNCENKLWFSAGGYTYCGNQWFVAAFNYTGPGEPHDVGWQSYKGGITKQCDWGAVVGTNEFGGGPVYGPTGQVTVEVPDVTGMTEEEAAAAIGAAELVLGTVIYECSDTVPAGDVISQDPVAGTEVDPGAAVNLVVSTGLCIVPVEVDIKPGSCPNPLNVRSQGVLPVAILGSEDFDVESIDPASIALAGVSAIRRSYEDVAGPVVDGNECDCIAAEPDGYMDMTIKFKTQQIVMAIADMVEPGGQLVLTLTGQLDDGHPIEGADCMIVVGQVPEIIDIMRADINGDGKVNGADLLILKKAWYKSY